MKGPCSARREGIGIIGIGLIPGAISGAVRTNVIRSIVSGWIIAIAPFEVLRQAFAWKLFIGSESAGESSNEGR